MRHITISVLSLLIVLPAFADVRLPVVNVAAGGVSARAAFGEPVLREEKTLAKNTDENKVVKKTAQNANQNRAVVSRSTTKKVAQPSASADVGEQLIASADVLVPHRPSSNLWANSYNSTDYVPLRLPQPQEFSVIRSDNALPEESLDAQTQQVFALNADPEDVSVSNNNTATIAEVTDRLAELDAKLAKLNELQRRADESVRSSENINRRVVSRSASGTSNEAQQIFNQKEVSAVASVKNAMSQGDEVKLSRLVVPMEDSDDVVVRAVQRAESPKIQTVRNEMTEMTPSELRKAFRKTFLSENKHLSTFQIDDRFDVASDMTANAEGFTSERDLSETAGTELGGIRPLEIKIKFRNEDAALSRDNYNLLTEYAGIVLSNPTRAVQVSIPQSVTTDSDERKLAARRLAIVEQVLRDNGISEQRILPVLSQRDEEGLVLRMISLDQYETLTQQQRNVFGDTVSKKTYRSMSW